MRRLIALLAACWLPAAAATLDDAVTLYKAGRYPEAERALRALEAKKPGQAPVAFYLGLSLKDAGDIDQGLAWLQTAVQRDPSNAHYLYDYGGTSLEAADLHSSFSLATRGRDALKRAIELNPADLDSRDALIQFYAKAPWPLGDKGQADTLAREMGRIDPVRGLAAEAFVAIAAHRYSEAIGYCHKALAQQPDSYDALYQLGRACLYSGTELDAGLAALRHCLRLPETERSVGPSILQLRIGKILEKKGDLPGAREAYQAAIRLDPKNSAAREALVKLPR